jgi:hypothetical protein
LDANSFESDSGLGVGGAVVSRVADALWHALDDGAVESVDRSMSSNLELVR